MQNTKRKRKAADNLQRADEPSSTSSKRVKYNVPPRTIEFDNVYQGGHPAAPKRACRTMWYPSANRDASSRYPSNVKPGWYIVYCEEHDFLVGANPGKRPLGLATSHISSRLHTCDDGSCKQKVTVDVILGIGWAVLNCDSKAEMHNNMLQKKPTEISGRMWGRMGKIWERSEKTREIPPKALMVLSTQ